MNDNPILKDYVLIKEVSRDPFGMSFLAKKTEDKTGERFIVVRLHDFISQNKENHERIKDYYSEIRKSSVPNILRPVSLIFDNEDILLVYPYVKGKNLKVIIDHMERKNVDVPFKTALETVLKIAVIVDMGSMVILNDQPSYHGFLIPENILIGYDGEIYLKYYGMLPFLSSTSYSFIKANYKIWLAPELIQRDEVQYRSEIYYLGHIIYRILTGKYFPLEPGNFENAVTNISFNKTIPSTDTTFLGNLLGFFKKTLHPAVDQRIRSFDIFTSYIADKFSITNTYLVKDDLSRLLLKLFSDRDAHGDTVPVEDFLVEGEDSAKTMVRRRIDPAELKGKLRKKKRSKALPFLITFVVLGVIAIYTISILDKKKTQQQPVNNQSPQVSTLENEGQSTEKEGEVKDPVKEDNKSIVKQEPVQKEDSGEDILQKEKESRNSEEKLEVKPSETPNRTDKKSGALKIPPKNLNKIFQLNELTEKPERIQAELPVLDYDLKKYYEKGPARVSITLLLDQKGRVGKVDLLTDVDQRIGDCIIKSLYKWRYTPGIKDGQVVKVEVPVSIAPTFKSKPQKTQKTEVIPLIPYKDLDVKPRKRSGEVVFSREVRRNYVGRRRTVNVSLLINQSGRVADVKIQSSLPVDLASELKDNLLKWRFSPPQKKDQKVRAWINESVRFEIK